MLYKIDNWTSDIVGHLPIPLTLFVREPLCSLLRPSTLARSPGLDLGSLQSSSSLDAAAACNCRVASDSCQCRRAASSTYLAASSASAACLAASSASAACLAASSASAACLAAFSASAACLAASSASAVRLASNSSTFANRVALSLLTRLSSDLSCLSTCFRRSTSPRASVKNLCRSKFSRSRASYCKYNNNSQLHYLCTQMLLTHLISVNKYQSVTIRYDES